MGTKGAKAVMHVLSALVAIILLCAAVGGTVKEGSMFTVDCPDSKFATTLSSQCTLGFDPDSSYDPDNFKDQFGGLSFYYLEDGGHFIQVDPDSIQKFNIYAALFFAVIALAVDGAVSAMGEMANGPDDGGPSGGMHKFLKICFAFCKIVMCYFRSVVFETEGLVGAVTSGFYPSFDGPKVDVVLAQDQVVLFPLSTAFFLILSIFYVIRFLSGSQGCNQLFNWLAFLIGVGGVLSVATLSTPVFFTNIRFVNLAVASYFAPRTLLAASSFTRMLGVYFSTGVGIFLWLQNRMSHGSPTFRTLRTPFRPSSV
eukprot:ANDGO_00727.mRNA.1 hypothetical protein